MLLIPIRAVLTHVVFFHELRVLSEARQQDRSWESHSYISKRVDVFNVRLWRRFIPNSNIGWLGCYLNAGKKDQKLIFLLVAKWVHQSVLYFVVSNKILDCSWIAKHDESPFIFIIFQKFLSYSKINKNLSFLSKKIGVFWNSQNPALVIASYLLVLNFRSVKWRLEWDLKLAVTSGFCCGILLVPKSQTNLVNAYIGVAGFINFKELSSLHWFKILFVSKSTSSFWRRVIRAIVLNKRW